ncbi:MAG: hypothetical protein K6A30_04590 [Lachnospiraceae bacterium]|nr:hypothetical protein [Lachnospiraceae bacterium]
MKENQSKTPLALMEQVIMVLVFALAAAVCVQAFVLARNMSIAGEKRDLAVLKCEEMAEEVKASHGGIEKKVLYFDKDWELQEETSTYKVEFKTIKKNSTLGDGKIIATEKGSVLFELPVKWQEVTQHE